MNKTTLKIMTLGKTVFFLMCLLVSINSYSQTTKFTTPTLKSGIDKQAGAKYLYPIVTVVNGTNVDAIVTVVSIRDASIVSIDNPTNGGLIDRFQPVVNTSRPYGYVEFQFSFYKSGTYDTAQELKIDLDSFIIEALDLDGNEFFDIKRPNNEKIGLEQDSFINVSTVGSYTRFQGPSNSVDPIKITNTEYIAAINFGTLSAIDFRLGNSSNSSSRQSSISFGEVTFIVPINPLANDDSSLCRPYGSVTLDVTINDTDSNQNIDKSKVDLNLSATSPGIQNSLIVAGEGTWSVNSTGIVTFAPLATFKANPTPIYYTINDLTNLTSNPAKITITYSPDAPTVSVVNNCDGTSILTASNFTGSLLWSNSATSASITVDTAGTYTVTQTVNGCPSVNGSGVAAPKMTPAAPTASATTQPTCAVATGTVTITAPLGSDFQYNVDGGTYQNSVTFSGLTAGSHAFTTRRISDNTCVSSATSITINAQPTAPAAPTASATTQPTCAVATGTVTITALLGSDFQYNVDGGTYQNSVTFSGLTSGSHAFTTRRISDNTCVSSATDVKVGNYICAVDDAGSSVNGFAGGTAFTNVLSNDTLNGVAVVGSNVSTTFVSSTNAGVTLSGTDVLVQAGTPAGNYSLIYTICEVLNADNCSTATVTVTVNAAPIKAVNDVAGPINGIVGGDAGINVLDNDLLNGVKVTPSEVKITATPNGPLTVNADGTVTVAPNTKAGEYTVDYTICEVLNADNCSTATVTVTVNAAPIKAVNDVAGPINGIVGGDAGINVLDNDLLNGVKVTPSEVKITATPNGPLTVNADGTVTVAPNTKAGEYTVDYTICEVLNADNCSTATVTVTVNAAPIKAVNDIAGPINGTTGGTTPSVLLNDTLNGVAVNPSDVVLTSTPNGPLTVNVNGTVTVAPNTPAGTYTVDYTICEVLNPNNCDTATVTVTVVAALIDAVPDVAGPINGTNGGTIPSVLLNDTLNGVAVNPSDVVLTSTPNGPLTVNANGTVTVAPNTPAGTYTVDYTICEVLNPNNCDTATVTVIAVQPDLPSISIVKTAVFNDRNNDGFAQVGETITYSFLITNTGNMPLSTVTVADNLSGLVLTGSPILKLAVGETNNTAYSAIYAVTLADIQLGLVTNKASVTGSILNGTVVIDDDQVETVLNEEPIVLPAVNCVIEVYNAVSPNGDGNNDFFRIGGLECYSDNRVEIYNRWGVLVFERDGYNNSDKSFKGISEGRVTVNQSVGLPTGTYYYILKYKDNEAKGHEKAGYLYINR